MIRAAERYSTHAYGLDLPFWWPRLWALLPEGQQNAVEDALTRLVALLNLATLGLLVTVDGTIYLLRCQADPRRWWWLVLLVGAVLAWLFYEAAVVQARSYGQRLRASADLYRLTLLKSLHVALPKSPAEERATWQRLFDWLYGRDKESERAVLYQHKEPESEKQPSDKDRRTTKESGSSWWKALRIRISQK